MRTYTSSKEEMESHIESVANVTERPKETWMTGSPDEATGLATHLCNCWNQRHGHHQIFRCIYNTYFQHLQFSATVWSVHTCMRSPFVLTIFSQSSMHASSSRAACFLLVPPNLAWKFCSAINKCYTYIYLSIWNSRILRTSFKKNKE